MKSFEINLDDFLKRISPVVLRFSLSAVFLWFGINQLLNSSNWTSYLPKFLLDLSLDPTIFIFANATLEIILAIFLILGTYIRTSAIILGIHLLGITWTIGFNATGVRDFGLALASLTIAFNGADFLSTDNLLQKKKIKYLKILTLVILAFIAAETTALSFGVYSKHKDKENSPVINPSSNSSDSNQLTGLTVEKVAQHNTEADCWIIVNNKVYDATKYIPVHPGGENEIIPLCGKDATQGFATRGGTGSHSQKAQNLLTNYYMGDIIASQQTTTVIIPTKPEKNKDSHDDKDDDD